MCPVPLASFVLKHSFKIMLVVIIKCCHLILGIEIDYGLLFISCQLLSLLGIFLAHARVYPEIRKKDFKKWEHLSRARARISLSGGGSVVSI